MSHVRFLWSFLAVFALCCGSAAASPPTVTVTQPDAKDFDLAVSSVSINTSTNPYGDVQVSLFNQGKQTWAFRGKVSISVVKYYPPGTTGPRTRPYRKAVPVGATIAPGQSHAVVIPMATTSSGGDRAPLTESAKMVHEPYIAGEWTRISVFLEFPQDQYQGNNVRSYRFRVDPESRRVLEMVALLGE